MKTSKFVASLLVVMAILLTITSTASAVSDRKIEKESIKAMFEQLNEHGVHDVVKSSVSIKSIIKNTREDGVQFAALEIMSESKEYGPCVAAIYVIFTADGELAQSIRNIASMDEKKGVYRSLAKFKALVKHLGDETAFMMVSM